MLIAARVGHLNVSGEKKLLEVIDSCASQKSSHQLNAFPILSLMWKRFSSKFSLLSLSAEWFSWEVCAALCLSGSSELQ